MIANRPPLTVIVPAYQEEKRIGATLRELLDHLAQHHPGTEVIVVSGGSTDNTVGVARQFESYSNAMLRVVELQTKGKGAAVRAGVFEASGEYVIFTDADLSYSPILFDQFIARLRNGADMAIAHRVDESKYGRVGRILLAKASRFLVGNIVTPGISDTQAGLKAFRRSVALDLFRCQRVDGFLFDIELLLLARRRGYHIEKIIVRWEDKPGSTFRAGRDTTRAAWDLLQIYWRLATGHYDR